MNTNTNTAERIETWIETLLSEGEDPVSLAANLGLDLDPTTDTVVLPGWVADVDGTCAVEYPEAEDASEAADLYVDGGDWGEATATHLIRVAVWRTGLRRSASGEVIRVRVCETTRRVVLEAEEPSCDSEVGEHDWQAPHRIVGGSRDNPGVWGNGAGIKIQEVCVRCGCGRLTDTYAQDCAGECFTSVGYEVGQYADEIGGAR